MSPTLIVITKQVIAHVPTLIALFLPPTIHTWLYLLGSIRSGVYILVKVHSEWTRGNIAQGCGWEANIYIARGKAKCYIILETMPLCDIFP